MQVLKLGQEVTVLFFTLGGFTSQRGIYKGIIQEKSLIQNEVHGVSLGDNLMAVLTEDELKWRLQVD
jgi:hypothetical protein